jgi:hypothetical protein
LNVIAPDHGGEEHKEAETYLDAASSVASASAGVLKMNTCEELPPGPEASWAKQALAHWMNFVVLLVTI